MISDMSEYLSRKVLTDLALNATRQAVDTQFNKIYRGADGRVRGFTGSLSGMKKRYKRDIERLLKEGIEIGRDNVQIAKDITAYSKGGTNALNKRAPKYANAKISKKIDWKALRIARTTIQGGVQDGQIIGYETTPSVAGFDWVLSPLHKVYSICEDIVADNPWTYETFGEVKVDATVVNFSTPPHPNCLSNASPRNIPRRQFLRDLKRWDGGDNVPYLDDWNKKYYEPTESGEVVIFDKLLDNNKKVAA